jgi:hypothetical protein
VGRPVTKKISLVKSGQEVVTAHIERLAEDNYYLLVWDGPWVKHPPAELEDTQGIKEAKTLITALHNLAKENNLKIQVRHPQDWKEFKDSIRKLSRTIGVDFVDDK